MSNFINEKSMKLGYTGLKLDDKAWMAMFSNSDEDAVERDSKSSKKRAARRRKDSAKGHDRVR